MLQKKSLFFALMAVAPVVAVAENIVVNDSSRVVDLDEVVVVSQPKEQVRLRLQPLSSNAFGSEQLNQLNVHDLSQLSQFVPSFVMPAYGSRLTSSMYVRGIGSRINNPAVGVYADNIPLMSKAAFNSHFYMLDRVDVMRGPQGTLYGQNTEGGLVRIYSKNPMNYQGTDVQLSIGNGLYRNVEVAHHHRPSQQLAFTVAGFYSGLKGFINNQNFDEKNDKSDEAGGKVRLVFQPSQRLKLDWTADYQYVNQNGFGYGQFQPIDYSDRIGGIQPAVDLHVQDPATTIMNGYKRNLFNTGVTLGYESDRLLFTSTTSYQFLNDRMRMDQDYMAPDYLRLEQRQKQNAVTQEFVLRSRSSFTPRSIRWQHATGLFGSYQWLRTDAPVFFGDAITSPISTSIVSSMRTAMQQSMYPRILQQMLDKGMPQPAAEAAAKQAVEQALGSVSMSAEMGVQELFHTPSLNLAAFHESNILLLDDRMKLTLGLRFNVDKMKIDYDALAYMNMTGGTTERKATYHLTSHVADNLSKSYTQLLPKVGLTYQFANRAGNVYALVSKGYRSGGYNIQMFSDILQTDLNRNRMKAMQGDYDVAHTAEDYRNIEQTIAYKPEESWNYEVGTHLNLFDSQLHLDLALYYMQVRNQQLSIMSPEYNYGRIMVNAGKSHSCGLEATVRGKAIDNALDWGVIYGFTNAKFDEYDDERYVGVDDVLKATASYKDCYVPFVPRHTFSAMADYHVGQLTLGANVSGQGKTWWDEANTYCQKFYALLGAHADYNFGTVVVSLWGRNLTNTSYNTFAVESNAAGGTRHFAQRANPLQVGVDLRMHF